MTEVIYGDVRIVVRTPKGRDALKREQVLDQLRATQNGHEADSVFPNYFAQVFTQTASVKGLGDLDLVKFGAAEILDSAEETRRLYETWLDSTDETLIYEWANACYRATNPNADKALAAEPPAEEVKAAAAKGDKAAKNS